MLIVFPIFTVIFVIDDGDNVFVTNKWEKSDKKPTKQLDKNAIITILCCLFLFARLRIYFSNVPISRPTTPTPTTHNNIEEKEACAYAYTQAHKGKSHIDEKLFSFSRAIARNSLAHICSRTTMNTKAAKNKNKTKTMGFLLCDDDLKLNK